MNRLTSDRPNVSAYVRSAPRVPSLALCALLATLITISGCATSSKPTTDATEVRRSVPELMALRPSDFSTKLASSAGERNVFNQETAALRAVLELPPGAESDEKLPGALASAALFNVEKPLALAALLRALPAATDKPPAYQRGLFSAAHTQFWNEAAPLIAPLLPNIKTPREFAIAAYTLLRANPSADVKKRIDEQMQMSFADWRNEPRLIALDRRLRVDPLADLAQRPDLQSLLSAPIRPGYPVVFSFQRHDREYMGLAMVRGADGRFVRNPDGTFFNIPQLAMARTKLPGTITNGNTPQGIFTIIGTGTAANQWIGPTPFLESQLPIEATVEAFEQIPAAVPPTAASTWSEDRYLSFLPTAWRDYFPMRETWLAGRAGRDEILAHGNTINPAYYTGERYYPAAPSAGCLVAMEYWSKDDGTLIHSDQLALVKAFASSGKDRGYLVVVELDDLPRAVGLADVVQAVIATDSGVR